MKNLRTIGLLLVIAITFLAIEAGAFYVDPQKYGSAKGEICLLCHKEASPGIYYQWQESAMGQAGVNCYDCHKAEKEDPDAFEHKEMISIVVTPKDCSGCHEKEYKEFTSSHHADAVKTLQYFDNFFGRAAWGEKAAFKGCELCHGSTLKVEKEGRLAPNTWPNTGIGRINPDGSKGSCTACHGRHIFSTAQARRPEACARCHIGPDNPQYEVYSNSKHGSMYDAFNDKMELDRRKWVVGQDYFQAPTCSTCHMGAIPPQMEVKNADERLTLALKAVLQKGDKAIEALLPPSETKKIIYESTHDLGTRLSWTLRPPVSIKQENWQEKREEMQKVCIQCHGEHFVEQFYTQFDELVTRYNKGFAIPATNMRKDLMKDGKLSKENFDEPLDSIYWQLVLSDGRRARHGASMMGPEYAWRQGMQEVAESFHLKFVPEIRKILGRSADRFLKKHGYVEPRQIPAK